MPPDPSLPNLRFRLVLGRSIAIGPGKADVLAAIDEAGPVSAAGRSMGMSYKKGWHLIDSMNRCFGEPLVVANKGGSARGGAQLTPMGQNVLGRSNSSYFGCESGAL
jgi:molybdate transport system regulatory protein